MKKMVLYILAILFVCSCSNDFELNREWKSIPIVYGLLNTADTAQYLRIEKAFLDESTSALEIAQRPDSLYFENPEVRLINESTGESFLLERVDGNSEGYVRDTGVFAQAPNYLYKIKSDVLFPGNPSSYAGETFSLSLKRNESLPEVTASTTIVGEPMINSVDNISFQYNTISEITWLPDPNAVLFDAKLKLNYLEQLNGGDFESKSLLWSLASNIEERTVEVPGIDFYTFMASNIEEDPTAVRLFLNVELIILSGGIEIQEFLNVAQANLGITSSQDIPAYTNLSEGRGLFSSRHRFQRDPVVLANTTLDSLTEGQFTKHLNFVP